jgi:hypothetical protein
LSGPPPNAREGRQRALVLFLRATLVLVVASSAAALALPGGAGETASTAMIALLIAIPLVRVAWLVVRWLRLGDLRFAATAAGLLVIVGTGALVASLV